MDTIKRLGEQETLNRIINGTLKSYVDHDIDSVDTSQFLNLETLNVPKAQSVLIGEGVKDTIEVINAPKAESIETYDGDIESCVEGLNDLLNLKVADVHGADVDVPMFKGCTNLERVTVGGAKGVEPLVVNWGKCGGSEDVIVTYNEGEGLWIPSAFLKQAFDYTFRWHPIGEGSTNYYVGEEIGYRGGYLAGSSSGLVVYNISQELGKYLYENAESLLTKGYYGQTAQNWTRAYKGLAIYPDCIGTNSSADWGYHTYCWGIGVRTKSDIAVQGYQADGTFSKLWANGLESGDFYNNMKEGTYYLVAQVSVDSSENVDCSSSYDYLQGQLSLFNIDDTGTDHIYLRHFKDMDSQPSATNMGKKYLTPSSLVCIPTLDSSYFEGCNNLKDVIITNPELRIGDAIPSELLPQITLYADESKVPVKEQPLVVNWGKCGGTSDVIVTYTIGDPIWIPKAFLAQGFGSDNLPIASNVGSHVGYQCVLDPQNVPTNPMAIYKLPQELGKWLYENAENMKFGYRYNYTSNYSYRIYHWIAIYPDNSRTWSGTNGWGVGIRKKDDIVIIGHDVSGNPTVDSTGKARVEADDNFKALEADAYYLVAQISSVSSAITNTVLLQGYLSLWDIDDTGTDHIWFRHVAELSRVPNANLKASKYTTSFELCKPQKNVYYSKTRKAQMVVNWGNLGGVTTFKEGDDLYLPHAFMYDAFSSITTNSDTLKSNLASAPSSDYVGYVGKCVSKSASRYLLVYKLPNEYGKHLYDIAKSGIAKFWTNYGDGGFYKGIFCVPTAEENISVSQSISGNYGIGIRKKSDVWQYTGGGDSISEDSTLKALLDDNSYYMVVGYLSNDCYVPLLRKYSNETDDFYLYDYTTIPAGSSSSYVYTLDHDTSVYRMDGLPSLQITMAEYLKENNPNYDFIPR